ncbi:unnamed protein product, partial [Nesidiocoris tenuis]
KSAVQNQSQGTASLFFQQYVSPLPILDFLLTETQGKRYDATLQRIKHRRCIVLEALAFRPITEVVPGVPCRPQGEGVFQRRHPEQLSEVHRRAIADKRPGCSRIFHTPRDARALSATVPSSGATAKEVEGATPTSDYKDVGSLRERQQATNRKAENRWTPSTSSRETSAQKLLLKMAPLSKALEKARKISDFKRKSSASSPHK